jgi:protein lysine acetyltransferase
MDTVRLRNGIDVAIRPIRPDDGPQLQQAYERLSIHSRYQRFLGLKSHLSEDDVHYLAEVDGLEHVALVATPFDDPDTIIAVGRFVRLREDPQSAEFAIVVGDQFQRQGLGSELLVRLRDRARGRGIERFTATVLAENVAAHRLLRGLNGELARSERTGPVDEIEVELAA